MGAQSLPQEIRRFKRSRQRWLEILIHRQRNWNEYPIDLGEEGIPLHAKNHTGRVETRTYFCPHRLARGADELEAS